MGPGEHRPYDEQYWTLPWAAALFAGDLFEAIPFGDQPTVLYTIDEGSEAGKHFVGEIAIGYGLLVTPTCDMPRGSGSIQEAARRAVDWGLACQADSRGRRRKQSVGDVDGVVVPASGSENERTAISCDDDRDRVREPPLDEAPLGEKPD